MIANSILKYYFSEIQAKEMKYYTRSYCLGRKFFSILIIHGVITSIVVLFWLVSMFDSSPTICCPVFGSISSLLYCTFCNRNIFVIGAISLYVTCNRSTSYIIVHVYFNLLVILSILNQRFGVVKNNLSIYIICAR